MTSLPNSQARLLDLLSKLDRLQAEVADALADHVLPSEEEEPIANAWACPRCNVCGPLAVHVKGRSWLGDRTRPHEEARLDVIHTTCPVCKGDADLAVMNLHVFKNDRAPSLVAYAEWTEANEQEVPRGVV